MVIKFNKDRITLISFIVFSLVVFISLLNFLFLDKTPPHWDYALHLKNTLIYYENLKNLNLIKFFSIYAYYPPLTYALLSLFISIIGYSKFTVLVFNFSFLSLMLYVAYRFTKTLFDKFTSLTLVSFLIFLIVTLSPSRILIWELMTDFPLMALIFIIYCAFYLSFKKNNFGIKKSLSLGLLVALTLLVKWSAVVYLFIPVVFYLILSFKKRHLKESLLIFYPILFLSGLWYFPHIKLIFRDLIKYGVNQAYLEQDPQWLKGVIFYFKDFLFSTWPANLIIPLLLILYLIKIIKGEKLFKKIDLLGIFDWLFVFFPCLLFTIFIPNKDTRYLYPIYIPLISVCFWRIRKYFNFNKIWFITPLTLLLIIFNYSYFLPKPFPDSLISHLNRIIWEKQPATVAYFFESDSHLFNYANIHLFHIELKQLYDINQPSYFFLNSMNIEDENYIHGCSYHQEPEAIFVFKKEQNDLIVNPKWQASFEEDCPLEFRDQYEIKEKINLYEEQLIYLTKKAV